MWHLMWELDTSDDGFAVGKLGVWRAMHAMSGWRLSLL